MSYDIIERLLEAEFHTLKFVRLEQELFQVLEVLYLMHKFQKV